MASKRSARFRSTVGDDGLSIIGVVIASAMIMMALLPAASLLENTIAVSGDNRHRVVAANLATKYIEQIKTLAQSNFSGLLTTYPALTATGGNGRTTSLSSDTQGETTYYPSVYVAWSAANFASGGCSSSTFSTSPYTSTLQPVLDVKVTVDWQNRRLANPITLTEIINPPAGAYSSQDGNVLVSVLSATGTGNPGVWAVLTDVATGASVQQMTDPNGCTFFQNVLPGNYSVSLTNALNPGYVTPQNMPSTTTDITVQAGYPYPLQFTFDQGATIQITGSSIAAQLANEFGFNIADSDLPTTTQGFVPPNTGGPPPTFGPIFPYANGATGWLGACTGFTPNIAGQSLSLTAGNTSGFFSNQYAQVTVTATTTTGGVTMPDPSVPVYALPILSYVGTTATPCPNFPSSVKIGTTDPSGVLNSYLPIGYYLLSTSIQAGTTTISASTPLANTDSATAITVPTPVVIAN